jgi:hypothetical protein
MEQISTLILEANLGELPGGIIEARRQASVRCRIVTQLGKALVTIRLSRYRRPRYDPPVVLALVALRSVRRLGRKQRVTIVPDRGSLTRTTVLHKRLRLIVDGALSVLHHVTAAGCEDFLHYRLKAVLGRQRQRALGALTPPHAQADPAIQVEMPGSREHALIGTRRDRDQRVQTIGGNRWRKEPIRPTTAPTSTP